MIIGNAISDFFYRKSKKVEKQLRVNCNVYLCVCVYFRALTTHHRTYIQQLWTCHASTYIEIRHNYINILFHVEKQTCVKRKNTPYYFIISILKQKLKYMSTVILNILISQNVILLPQDSGLKMVTITVALSLINSLQVILYQSEIFFLNYCKI